MLFCAGDLSASSFLIELSEKVRHLDRGRRAIGALLHHARLGLVVVVGSQDTVGDYLARYISAWSSPSFVSD